MGINEGPGSLKSKKREVEGKKKGDGSREKCDGIQPRSPRG